MTKTPHPPEGAVDAAARAVFQWGFQYSPALTEAIWAAKDDTFKHGFREIACAILDAALPHLANEGVAMLESRQSMYPPDDARCTVTSWEYGKGKGPKKYGPGGHNRCIFGMDDGHPVHEDEWGTRYVFTPEWRRLS